jgi:hypothetical protein
MRAKLFHVCFSILPKDNLLCFLCLCCGFESCFIDNHYGGGEKQALWTERGDKKRFRWAPAASVEVERRQVGLVGQRLDVSGAISGAHLWADHFDGSLEDIREGPLSEVGRTRLSRPAPL